MVRAISLLGFGGGFLAISPNLRSFALGGISTALDDLSRYSPWSYVVCGIAGLILVTVSVNRGSRAH